jgi:hypothetical protein
MRPDCPGFFRIAPTFVAILSTIDERTLLLFVGIVVIAFTGLQASGSKVNVSSAMEKPVGVAFGLSSGVIHSAGSYSASIPTAPQA